MPERGRLEAPAWIRQAIDLKREKHYSSAEDLNLLVYANFSAGQLQCDEIANACEAAVDSFASIWVLSSTHLYSLSAGSGLPKTRGWLVVRPIEYYYTRDV
jgi:hypothetical protein